MRRQFLAVSSALLLITVHFAQTDTLAQTSEFFPRARETQIGGQTVKLALTGHAIRKKVFFQVYAVASYVEQGASVRTAQELVAVDCAKQLHLIMLRTVSGSDMAESLLAILRQNHPAPAFDAEAKALADVMRSGTAQKGDHIWITHVPGTGLHFKRVGGEDILIRNVAFSSAVWENYLGKHNVSEDVKQGLLSMLK